MDFINQALDSLKNSPNPETYYITATLTAIVGFYILGKILRIISFLGMICVAYVGINMLQGKDFNTAAGPFISISTQLVEKVSNITENTLGMPLPIGNKNTEEEQNDIKELLDNVSKLKNGK